MNENNNKLRDRWVDILKHKASQYEDSDVDGRTSPSIHTICSEIVAFFDGLNYNK